MTIANSMPPRRAGTVSNGNHGPITVSVCPLDRHSLEYYYHFRCVYEGQIGALISYRGHKDDIVAARLVKAETLKSARRDVFLDHEYGLLCISSKAGPNKRGWIEVNYYVDRFALRAPLLPGVTSLYPEGIPHADWPDWKMILSRKPLRPKLRLVVDNTRGRLS